MSEDGFDAERRNLRELLHEVWDDGNCTGLDGFAGEGRCLEIVDSEAIRRRDRVIGKVMPELSVRLEHRIVDTWQERPYEFSYRCSCGHITKHREFGPVPRCPAIVAG